MKKENMDEIIDKCVISTEIKDLLTNNQFYIHLCMGYELRRYRIIYYHI